MPRCAQFLELRVRVEHERRPAEAACEARTAGMQPDDEKCVFSKAEREMRIVRIAADARIPFMMDAIELVQLAQLRPELTLELTLGCNAGIGEHGYKVEN